MANNILITPVSASIQFSGSAVNTIRLQVEDSGSVAFYGLSGSLFGISDQLSGSLMSVNDVSGLPILEVFSDDRVVMGSYGNNTLVVSGSNVSMNGPVTGSSFSASLGFYGTASYARNNSAIGFIMDGGGGTITTGSKGDISVPFNCTITSWNMLADQVGSITVDVWKDTYANYPPTAADSITGSANISITSANKNQSSTLTGWTTTITAGDTLRYNVVSATTITRATLTLNVIRT